jgi:hypothetical protein
MSRILTAMAYFKVLLAALLGAVIGVVLWIIVGIVLPAVLPMLTDRLFNRGGIGAVAIGFTSNSILLAAIVGLVLGGAWGFRRFVPGL